MAKLTKTIFGVPDGEIYPRDIAAGEDCPPNLEAYATDEGALAERPEQTIKAVATAPKGKAEK